MTFRRHLNPETVVLLIEIMPRADQKVNVWVRLTPTDNLSYLPDEMELTLFDELGTSRGKTEDIRKSGISFQADSGDRFDIRLKLGDSSVTESFII